MNDHNKWRKEERSFFCYEALISKISVPRQVETLLSLFKYIRIRITTPILTEVVFCWQTISVAAEYLYNIFFGTSSLPILLVLDVSEFHLRVFSASPSLSRLGKNQRTKISISIIVSSSFQTFLCVWKILPIRLAFGGGLDKWKEDFDVSKKHEDLEFILKMHGANHSKNQC